jgi:3-methylfumaryl-CoA hydratase
MSTDPKTTELIGAGPAEALAGLLGVPVPDLERDGVPPLWHWVYLLEHPAQSELGPEGHPLAGIPSPPEPGRRRMFAGGRVRRHRPLRIGAEASRQSRVLSSVGKAARSGPMTITTVEHRVWQDGELVLTDEQDIVYLTASPRTEAAPDEAATTGGWAIPVDPVLLFRFSALTYNAHRIHYDAPYARDVEGYPGLVVHGPLQAIAMATAAAAPGQAGDGFDYRLVAPLYLGQGLHVHVERSAAPAVATCVTDGRGRVTATGSWQPSC